MTYEGEPLTGYTPSNWSLTNTGYYIRKFNDPNVGLQNMHNQANFKEYRYAEILLNFAEAAAQTNHRLMKPLQLSMRYATEWGCPISLHL
jgi:hypothetical protein